MCAPSPPPPPDPKETASAQTGTNVATSIANNTMGMVNQNTPYGSLTYDQTGTYVYTDPYTGETYRLPTYTATTSLSPEEQAILDSNQAARTSLANVAADRGAFLEEYLPQTEAMTDSIDDKLYEMATQRIDPRYAQEEEALRAQLANQGIAPGTEAYNREMDLFYQGKNDAYNQLALTGRNQAMAEVNAPINQITALLSGSQVSNPSVSMYQPQPMPTTDVAGIINSAYQQELNAYNQSAASTNSMLGGLFDIGSSLIMGW